LDSINSCLQYYIRYRDRPSTKYIVDELANKKYSKEDYLLYLKTSIENYIQTIKYKEVKSYLIEEICQRIYGFRDNTYLCKFWLRILIILIQSNNNYELKCKPFINVGSTSNILETYKSNIYLINLIKEDIKNLINFLNFEEILQLFLNCQDFEQIYELFEFLYDIKIINKYNLTKVKNYIIDNFGFSSFEELSIYYYKDIYSYDISKLKNSKSEKQIQDYIIQNFNKIFPDYEFVGKEICVDKIGKIDILAKDKKSKRDVIIEIKKGEQNPNKQLLAYAKGYDNPILIGITNMCGDLYLKEINYYTLKDIGFVKELGNK
jgi:Predicted nuclease of the RecB family